MKESNPYQTPELAYEVPGSLRPDDGDRGPSGLGGWLILLAFGLVLSPFRLTVVVLLVYLPLFQDGTWATLTTPGTEQYHPLWGPLLVFELISNTGFIIAYATLTFLFFRKSRYFPKAYIAVALCNLSFVILDTWFVSFVLPNQPMLDANTAKEIFRSLFSAAIWVPYMLISKRVKNTFVR